MEFQLCSGSNPRRRNARVVELAVFSQEPIEEPVPDASA